MTYNQMITMISQMAGVPKRTVKEILFAVPDVLINLEEDEIVRTPMGTFRMFKRASKSVTPPKGQTIKVPEGLVVKLRPTARMRKPV
jgi:nucleoid DNA-binding protein